MVQFNIVNFITVGVIAVLAVIVVRGGAKALNKTSPV